MNNTNKLPVYMIFNLKMSGLRIAILIVCSFLLVLCSLFLFNKISGDSGNKFDHNHLQGLSVLKHVKDIPLSGGANRYDYQSINPLNNRLYISHMNSNMVTVFDLKTESIVADIKDISHPTGILAVPELGKVYVSSSRTDEVVVINEKTLKIVNRISTGSFPDGIAYDPQNKRIFVSNERGKQVTVIDAQSDNFIQNIDIGGEVGNTHYDPVSKSIYCTDQSNDELVQINPATIKIIQNFKLKDCKGAHGFYIDAATHYAIITGEAKGQFVVFDLTATKIIYNDQTGAEPDVLAFDTTYQRLYVAAEDGIVSAFQIKKNNIQKLSEEFLDNHAHSVSVDQKTHKVYFPLENVKGKPVLRIMEPLQ